MDAKRITQYLSREVPFTLANRVRTFYRIPELLIRTFNTCHITVREKATGRYATRD